MPCLAHSAREGNPAQEELQSDNRRFRSTFLQTRFSAHYAFRLEWWVLHESMALWSTAGLEGDASKHTTPPLCNKTPTAGSPTHSRLQVTAAIYLAPKCTLKCAHFCSDLRSRRIYVIITIPGISGCCEDQVITGLLSLEPSSTAHAGDAVYSSLSLTASVASVASPLGPCKRWGFEQLYRCS